MERACGVFIGATLVIAVVGELFGLSKLGCLAFGTVGGGLAAYRVWQEYGLSEAVAAGPLDDDTGEGDDEDEE